MISVKKTKKKVTVTCKSNDISIDAELDVEGKIVTKDPGVQRPKKSMRWRRDNVFLRDYVA